MGETDNPGRFDGAVLIAGPTASGKSALAVAVAERIGGIVVNADSMQVYDLLEVLTARPSPDDLARVPHRLYGHVAPHTAYSTGAWLRDVAALDLQRRRPVFVGGTGLYFKALTEGLSTIPAVPDELRMKWRQRMASEGADALHAELQKRDAEAADRIRSSDSQRIVRALELNEATGLPLTAHRGDRTRPLVALSRARAVVLEPDRAVLAEKIDERFRQMLERGGLEEARALSLLDLDPALPAMKAIGVPPLLEHLRGGISLEQATAEAVGSTRRYAKRQSTWFRTQTSPEWARYKSPEAALRALSKAL